jgi:UDP-glucuronate 4-epimerase
VMAHSYAHLYQLPSTGLRFFTVYGPWGRPDMAPIKFTEKIIKGEPIDIYNYGKMQRDFTYIDDIIEGMMRVIDKPACGDENWDATGPNLGRSDAPFKIYNIGYGKPIQLMDFVTLLEDALGIKAKKQLLPMQPGDVIKTFADTSDLEKAFGFKPQIAIEKGVKRFVDWYKTYYNI